MFQNQRHHEILNILKEQGFASVSELSERLYASPPTIRRDLAFLQKEGLIHRSHGGAISADEKKGAPVSFRSGTKLQQKNKICRLASQLIRPGSLILIDASTTGSHLVDFMSKDDELTVVTNGYPICQALAEKNIRTFSSGGRLLKNSMAFVGKTAEDVLRQFNADFFFFSSSSLDSSGIISDYSEEETALRKVMFQQSRQSVFLCDSEKFNSQSPFRFFPLKQVHHVVTDAPLSDSVLRQNGLSEVANRDGAFWYTSLENFSVN